MPETPRPFVAAGGLMNHFFNPLVVRLGLAPVLEVRGRTSGKLRRVPLGAPLEFDGARYLVAGRGETHWVRNLRTAGQATLRAKGRRETFVATEILGEERDRIVAAYRAKLGHSVDRYFDEIPNLADHPVFRIDPASASD